MKILVVARHGRYHQGGGLATNRISDGPLNEEGCRQMQELAESLLDVCHPFDSVHLMSSPANRCFESAAILADTFRTGIETKQCLWGDYFHPIKTQEAVDFLVQRIDIADVLMVVTHRDLMAAILEFFLHDRLKTSHQVWTLGHGQAWVLDCSSKVLTLVAPA